MDVKHSRRILAIGAPGSPSPDVIKDLTGSVPPKNEDGSSAGQMHEWDVKTAYYNAKVPIWIDEIADTEQWKTEFLRPEAKEVIEAVGAFVYCFRIPHNGEVAKEIEEVMKAVQEISEKHAGYGADTAMLAVALPPTGSDSGSSSSKHDDWENVCIEHGFEFIKYGVEGKNEYGEKVGFERLIEALEANEWNTGDADDDFDVDDLDFGPDEDIEGISRAEAEWTQEFFGVKAALNGDDEVQDDGVPTTEDHGSADSQARQVDALDRMMGKLMAVKEQSADLPEAQRKRVAAQAIKNVMQEGSNK